MASGIARQRDSEVSMLESVGCLGLSSRRMRITELARRLAAQEFIVSHPDLLQAPAPHRTLGPILREWATSAPREQSRLLPPNARQPTALQLPVPIQYQRRPLPDLQRQLYHGRPLSPFDSRFIHDHDSLAPFLLRLCSPRLRTRPLLWHIAL